MVTAFQRVPHLHGHQDPLLALHLAEVWGIFYLHYLALMWDVLYPYPLFDLLPGCIPGSLRRSTSTVRRLFAVKTRTILQSSELHRGHRTITMKEEQAQGSVGVAIVFHLLLRLRLHLQMHLLPILPALREPALGSVDMLHELSLPLRQHLQLFPLHLVLMQEVQILPVMNKARAKTPYYAFLSIDSCRASTMPSRAVTIGSSLHTSPSLRWRFGS
ncbi:hypothetical protein N9L68_03160 [bacterium]|nr:hypothetical protein [bacterium]